MGLRSAILRILRLRPFRACFLFLAPWLEARMRSYFHVKRALAGDAARGTGAGLALEALVDTALALANDREKERLHAWFSERLAQGESLKLAVDQALARSKPLEKQTFYGWIEDRATWDEHAVAYAERSFEWFRGEIERHRGPLRGARILEIGPGHTLVAGILFYVHGARSYTGADLFPIAGRDVSFYKRLRQHLAERPALVPLAPGARAEALRAFDEVVKLEGPEVALDESKVAYRHPVDAAKLPFPDGSFDAVLSLASFEHFSDPGAAVRECARVTAPGGLGLHQIDLRDHRDFTRPIDFLRYQDEEWRKLNADPFCYTNRWRRSDFERAFAESGLAVAHVNVSLKVPFDPKLRPQLTPRFRDRTLEDLETLSAFFVVKKPEQPANAVAV